MKIGIIGMGKVGSTLAFSLIFNKKVKEVFIIDIDRNKLEGERLDLSHASHILKGPKYTKSNSQKILDSDLVFITAGFPRNPNQSDESLLCLNRNIISKITSRIGSGHHIVTNPVEMLAELYEHIPVGPYLDKIREETDGICGDTILKLKGYTNFGIVAECLKIIKEHKP